MFGNLRKFSENFGNGSKVIFRCFYDFFKFSENLWKSSEILRNGSKVIFRCFYDFLIFSENLRKCSEIFGDIFTSEDMENILRGTRMYCHVDFLSGSGLFSSKTLLLI